MAVLPRSRTARRRLMIFASAAPILGLAVGLTLYGLKDKISYFYTPAQAQAAHVAAGRNIQLGGLVEPGSVVRKSGEELDFVIADLKAKSPVVYHGEVPDLFREGQGVVAMGAYGADGVFNATQVLAKHDEKYMPREVAQALKQQGEWRGKGSAPNYEKSSSATGP